jgi:hypothetical protein
MGQCGAVERFCACRNVKLVLQATVSIVYVLKLNNILVIKKKARCRSPFRVGLKLMEGGSHLQSRRYLHPLGELYDI